MRWWTLALLSGCYLSHGRPMDGAVPSDDAGARDAPERTDVPDAPLPPGCRAVCAPPQLLADVALPGPHDLRTYRFADAATVDDTIVVLTDSPFAGHAPPRDRLLFVDTVSGEVRTSEAWEASGFFPQHHNGTRILSASREGVTVLTLAGLPEFEGSIPTGRQSVSVHLLRWSWDGELVSRERLIDFAEPETLGCVGGCEAGIAIDAEHALVSYAPDGELFVSEVPLDTLEAGPWEGRGPIGDGAAEPWPHRAAIWAGEHWIAGGGTPDLAEPRAAFLYAPGMSPEPLAGSMDDLPPLLLGGETLVIARHVSGPVGSFRVQRLRPGEPVEAIRVRTGPLGALSGWLSRDAGERVVLAWASLAPGTLRDTLLTVTPEAPFSSCDEVEPTTVARIPQGIVAPSVLAHALGDALYVMAFANAPGEDAPELVVFALRGCALTE